MAPINTPLGPVVAISYPGRIVKVGDPDSAIVKKIEERLNDVGCGPISEDGVFDKSETKRAVKLFQSRFTDTLGNPLKIDGQVGPLTWSALFGASSIPSTPQAPTTLTKEVVAFATTQVGTLENPLGSNRGPEVNKYLVQQPVISTNSINKS